ncbi:argininosuccinate synthase domain-containing protein [Bartonella koehlerae]|uniref:Uncharacterized protein n=1 Tax=Bartonella koehlerae C-29 TaxID=1134510 RepID=A0A067W7X6_9HYPH|nr:argininosuccinate synthase domain-containing protein [Bartonella koehlerae]KEC56085.1 hypothetical protein O9A_00310 [Bartonella koehlerae C-29]
MSYGIVKETRADAIASVATGNGNKLASFKLSAYTQNHDIKIFLHGIIVFSKSDGFDEFCACTQIPIENEKQGETLFSVDENLLYLSSEGKILKDLLYLLLLNILYM